MGWRGDDRCVRRPNRSAASRKRCDSSGYAILQLQLLRRVRERRQQRFASVLCVLEHHLVCITVHPSVLGDPLSSRHTAATTKREVPEARTLNRGSTGEKGCGQKTAR